MTRRCAAFLAFGTALLGLPAVAADAQEGGRVAIVTSDVDRFFALYDDPALAAQPETIAARYLAVPTPGLAEFMTLRRITPDRLAVALRDKRQVFDDARGCAAKLGGVRPRLAAATDRLAALYPQAKFPPITIAIGRASTAGTANAKGLYIGLEALCAAKFIEADDEDRFVHVIAHEYVHAQQPLAQVEDPEEKVLRAALGEGVAEFVGEQMSGSVGYPLLHQWAKGREKELETAFLAEKDEKAIGSRWLYNKLGSDGWPGDLGYWVGYRIVKSYYNRAPDKAAAIREIIEMKDPAAFLAASGWTPGIAL
ncbi:gliding motility protein GldB-related protein [Sphingopyxis panaciterrae]